MFTTYVKFCWWPCVNIKCVSGACCLSVSYLSGGDANTQPIHCRLLFPLVDLGELFDLQDV